MEEKKFLTAREAAQYLGLAVSYLYKLTSWHKIPYYQPTGKHILFQVKELDNWVTRGRIASDEELVEQAQKDLVLGKGGRK